MFYHLRQNTQKMVLSSCCWTNYCNQTYPIMLSKTICNVLAVSLFMPDYILGAWTCNDGLEREGKQRTREAWKIEEEGKQRARQHNGQQAEIVLVVKRHKGNGQRGTFQCGSSVTVFVLWRALWMWPWMQHSVSAGSQLVGLLLHPSHKYCFSFSKNQVGGVGFGEPVLQYTPPQTLI